MGNGAIEGKATRVEAKRSNGSTRTKRGTTPRSKA
jgi:hypothetical protein